MSIDGTDFADTLSGTLGDDVITAAGGNDIIHGSQGTDTVDGGSGADRLIFTLSDASLFATAGAARSYTIGLSTVTDTSGLLNTGFTSVENITFSLVGAGNFADTIDASGFNPGASTSSTLTFFLGDGNASVIGSWGNDTITTGRGDNVVNASFGTDTILGSQGHDVIDSGHSGAFGDRMVFTMSRADLFDAATGPRTYTITADHVGDSIGILNTDFVGVKRFIISTVGTGDFDDVIDASGFVTSTAGLALTATLGNGDNTVIGSNYADFISVGTGQNVIDGGAGHDDVQFRYDNTTGETLYLTGSGGTVIATLNGVVLNSFTNIEGVTAWGSDGNAAMTVVDASGLTIAGQVTFFDTNGTNIGIGHNGADFFSNGYLNVLGNDTYTGNGGADIYDYTFAVGGMDGDHITDFDGDDVIDLRFNDSVNNGGGLLANQFIGTADFSGVAGQYRYFAYDNQTFVQVDTNGDMVADEMLTIGNGQFALAETTPGSNLLQIIGTSGTGVDDFLVGTLGDDIIYAEGGDDFIAATGGMDHNYGGAGFDQLRFITGDADRFVTPSASRTITITDEWVGASDGTINSYHYNMESIFLRTTGTGDHGDTIDASALTSAGLVLRLGNGDDTVIGSAGDDDINTGLGINSVDAGGGQDLVVGQFDNTSGATAFVTFDGSAVVTTVNGVAANMVSNAELVGVQGSDFNAAMTTIDASGLTGYTGQIIFWDNNGSNIAIGSAGSDMFANVHGGETGNDVYTGNGGADIYDYTFAVGAMDGDTITDFDADDVIDLQFNNATQNGGGLLANQFIGTADFSGVAGQYRYFASGGQTFVQVDTNGDGAAEETLTIGNGQFALGETFAGSNILHIIGTSGTSGNDTLTGTLGDDSIYAQGSSDIINGSQGNDYIDGGNGGGDRLFMNTGTASLFTAATGARSYTIGNGTITDSSGTLDTSFTGIERIAFSTVGNGNFNDVIDASGYFSAHSVGLDIRVGNGDNLITGSGSNDRIFTGFGSNIADGGAGYDYGFAAIDTSSDATVFITTVGNTLVTTVNGVSNSFTNFEEMQVFGVGTAALTLDATGWTPILGQALYLVGHNGTDIMIGSTGNDFFANATGQVLGTDVYTGNGGADIYDYTFAADSMNGDTITDFDIDDVIDFRFNNLELGGSPLLCNAFIGAAAFSGIAGEYRYQIDGTQTVVQLDSDGDMVADQVVTISNGAFMLAETEPGSNILTLAATIDPLAGIVADGYLEGATLFVDIDGDQMLDDGEAWTVTGPGGSFSLNVNQGGTLVAIGGINADTGLANTMTLAAPSDSGIVNPLTTLIQAVVDQSDGTISADDAMTQVKAALGLDPSLDLFNLDLIAAAATDPAALAAQKAAAMIANLVTTAEGAAEAGAGTEALLVAALADLVADGGGTIDLTDTDTLTPLLTDALPGVDVGAIADEIAFEGVAIAAATSIDEIGDAQLDAHEFNHVAGGDGNDLLTGGTGRDRIVGGDGVDFLRGGDGDDLFVTEVTPTQVNTKAGTLSLDVIFDFGAGDQIDLSGLDANLNISGHQSFNWNGTNANKSAGDLSFKTFDSVKGAEKALGYDIDGVDGTSPYSGPVTIVYGNIDGGAPDFALALIGVDGVTTSDFLFG